MVLKLWHYIWHSLQTLNTLMHTRCHICDTKNVVKTSNKKNSKTGNVFSRKCSTWLIIWKWNATTSTETNKSHVLLEFMFRRRPHMSLGKDPSEHRYCWLSFHPATNLHHFGQSHLSHRLSATSVLHLPGDRTDTGLSPWAILYLSNILSVIG